MVPLRNMKAFINQGDKSRREAYVEDPEKSRYNGGGKLKEYFK